MAERSSKVVQLVIGFGISTAAISYLIVSTDWNKVGNDLTRVNWLIFVPTLAMFLFHFFLRAIRWRYLLPELPEADNREVTTRRLFDAISIGNFTTYLLPLRVGEFVRPYVLSLWTRHSFGSGFMSVVVERFFDLMCVLLTFALIIPFLPERVGWAEKGALALGALAFGIFVFILLGCLAPDLVRKIVRRVLSVFHEKLRNFGIRFTDELLTGTQAIRSPARLFVIVALSILVWLTCYLQFYIAFFLFPEGGTFLMALTVAVMVGLAVALPSAPGFIGVYQFGCTVGFGLFGYDPNRAVAYAIITHVVFYAMYMFLGGLALARNNLSFSEVRTAALNRA